MARTMSTAAVGGVNRRFLFLALILAILSAVLVYAAISRSGSDGGGASAVDVPVVVTKAAIPAGTRITAEMLHVREFPATSVGDQAFSSVDAVVGKVARYPIAANEQVLLSKVVTSTAGIDNAIAYVLEEGMRGMAVSVNEVISVGGLVLPGDHVDILWVPFKGAPSFTLLSDVEVTAVSQSVVDVVPAAPGLQEEQSEEAATGETEGQRARASEAEPQPKAITVTLMITSEQTRALFCAEEYARQFGGGIRLAVRSFGDATPANIDAPPCPPLDLMLDLLGGGA